MSKMLKVNIQKKLKEFDLEVDFELKKGCLGILGPSGCGKSMTLKSVAGIVDPDIGVVSLTTDKETVYFETKIVPAKIREQFSRTASNSWVKCKKKLVVEDSFNPRVGKKSLWHSLRIIEFGIQILRTGKINNYGCVNHLYDPIVNNTHNDWEHYQHYYQPIYNAKKSMFRLAEKGT